MNRAGPLEAVLFDVDGTLCDSDPLHFEAFRDLLKEAGFQGGVPIDNGFYSKNLCGSLEVIYDALFPEDRRKALQFMEDKEAYFQRLAKEKLVPVSGLHDLCKWIEDKGIRRAAVTNSPRANAEAMISAVGLSEFFEFVVLGEECERGKPYPDPYLKALKCLGVPAKRAMVFEDSSWGIKAGVAAGLPVVGLTTSKPEQKLLDAGASLVIKDFEDSQLWKILEGIETPSS
ncbi:haloacid dehalogenase-like hydrolase domain-containing protein Sgpp [Nymphaea colorata]|nr:haloacid dehalogenase-like hydrolase domain-containing protein Sgpp [Nymphaea colorata]